MKTTQFFAVIVIFLMALPIISGYTQRTAPILDVSLVNQQPNPVEPGEVVELNFRFENKGEQKANDIIVEIIPEYPLSLRPGEPATKKIGTIESKQTASAGIEVDYKLIVDKGAPDGDHEFDIRYKAGEESNVWITVEDFVVDVQSSNALLGITKTFSVPSVTAPGDKTKVSIGLENYASSFLKNVRVQLDLDETPFNPVGSSNEKVISRIYGKESQDVQFELIVDPDAEANVYQIPTTIVYTDILAQNYSRNNIISLVIGDIPDLTVNLESTDVYTKGGVGSVVLRFVNKGTTDVKFLNVQVKESESIEVIGSSEAYIGNLDSDDFSTEEFTLFVKEGDGEVTVPITIEYKDANNNNYLRDEEIALKLYSSSEAKKRGLTQGGGSGWIIMVLLVGGAGFWYYRKRKKR